MCNALPVLSDGILPGAPVYTTALPCIYGAVGLSPRSADHLNWHFPPTTGNDCIQVLSGITIAIGFYYLGWRSMMYHFLCLSFETNAFVSVWRTGQDVSEHNPLEDDRPTNSHYYWLYNFLFLNTGYHNEHHTFPQVAGPRLPALKAAAPEFFTSEIKISYFAQFAKQFMSHFESYRLSEDQENTMGSVCLKKAQAQYAKDNAEKNAKIAELSRTTKTASKAA